MVFQLLINPSVPCMKYCMPWLVPINVSRRTHNMSKQFPAMYVKFSKMQLLWSQRAHQRVRKSGSFKRMRCWRTALASCKIPSGHYVRCSLDGSQRHQSSDEGARDSITSERISTEDCSGRTEVFGPRRGGEHSGLFRLVVCPGKRREPWKLRHYGQRCSSFLEIRTTVFDHG